MNVDQSVSEPLTVIIIRELLCGVLKYKFNRANIIKWFHTNAKLCLFLCEKSSSSSSLVTSRGCDDVTESLMCASLEVTGQCVN